MKRGHRKKTDSRHGTYSVIEEYTSYKMPVSRAIDGELFQPERKVAIFTFTSGRRGWRSNAGETKVRERNLPRLSQSLSTTGHEQVNHARSLSSGTACCPRLIIASSAKYNPFADPTAVRNCTKCHPDIVLARSDPKTPSPKLAARRIAKERQVEGMESGHFLHHHIPLDRIHVHPDDCTS